MCQKEIAKIPELCNYVKMKLRKDGVLDIEELKFLKIQKFVQKSYFMPKFIYSEVQKKFMIESVT